MLSGRKFPGRSMRRLEVMGIMVFFVGGFAGFLVVVCVFRVLHCLPLAICSMLLVLAGVG